MNITHAMVGPVETDTPPRRIMRRSVGEIIFFALVTASFVLCLGTLVVMVVDLVQTGAGRLSWQFLSGVSSRRADRAGVLPAIAGTVWVTSIAMILAVPIGVGAAVYLEECCRRGVLSRILEIAIANLAGVPAIIFGMVGLQLFVRWCGFGRSVLSGGLTMALVVLPLIILVSREAIRSVPRDVREGSLALGASTMQTVWYQVLPAALPGLLTGAILGVCRIIGEAAPLLALGAVTYLTKTPSGLESPFTTLPIQVFNWISRPQVAFHQNAAGAIMVLLLVLFILNGAAIVVRARGQRRG
jgi:phosphate transport system permease protein